jgi:glutamyl-tRNA reductase
MYLYGSNDWAEARERTREASPSALPDAGRWIAEAASSFVAEAGNQATDPVVARYSAALKSVQTSELERLYNRLPELDEHSRQVIWQFSDCLVAKMLHPPLECLRDESRNGTPRGLLDALQRLFRLGD